LYEPYPSFQVLKATIPWFAALALAVPMRASP
jgi:hypothetical protein